MGDKVWRVEQGKRRDVKDPGECPEIVWVAEYQGKDGGYRRRVYGSREECPKSLDVVYLEPYFFGLLKKCITVHCWLFRVEPMRRNEKGELEYLMKYW